MLGRQWPQRRNEKQEIDAVVSSALDGVFVLEKGQGVNSRTDMMA